MAYIGKIIKDTTTYQVGSTLYGTCDTAAGTAAKVAVVNGFDTLETGVTVHIKFTYSNTSTGTITLAIKPSSSGTATTAKNIYKYGTTKPGTNTAASWEPGSVISFTYDGTSWMMNDHLDDTNFNNAVTQTEITSDNNYEVTFSGTASTATKTEGVGKSAGFIYNPSKKAVTAGSRNSSTVIGSYSSVLGEGCEASGRGSHAEGFKTTSSGTYSHAEGNQTVASGENPHSEGTCTTASGGYSHAEGYYTYASGYGSHAEGNHALASASNAHAEGAYTTASDISAHAEGQYTQATTAGAHAEGYASSAKPHIASGLGAHVEGYGTSAGGNTASGNGAHAEGFRTLATVYYAHAEGNSTTASGAASHAEGAGTKASNYNAHAEGNYTAASGDSSHAEGYYTTASGNYSHAEGSATVASNNYSHAEGIMSIASGTNSHAEGYRTTASGANSHAEGGPTNASGSNSHAQGSYTTASGNTSHAEGSYTCASGSFSHVEGAHTIANHKSQHVFGEYNLADASTAAATARGDYIEIVGNGLSSTQLGNARTLDWDGNEWLAGKLYSSGVVAQSSGTANVNIGYDQISVNDTQESHTALWIHSDDIVLPDVQIDQEVYTNTWDGTNSSLKAAVEAVGEDSGWVNGSAWGVRRKVGHVVQIVFNQFVVGTARTWHIVTTLPSDWLPAYNMEFPIIGGDHRQYVAVCKVRVSNGDAAIYVYTTGTYYGSFTYLV